MASNGKETDSPPFGELVSRLWDQHEGRLRAPFANLWVLLPTTSEGKRSISYEGLRLMLSGKLEPRDDVMREVAVILGVPPQSFREYRLYEIRDAFKRHPDMETEFYDAIMGHAEALDRKKKGGKGG